MTISIRQLSACAFVLSTGPLVACNIDSTGSTDAATQALTADGTEVVTSNVQESSFGELAFSITQKDPVMAATEVLTPPATGLYPASCATRTKDATDPRVVHIHFADCTGPFGLRHLNGDETAVFSANPDGTLHVSLSDAGNLTVNGKPVHHSADGDITIAGSKREVAWKGQWNRENDAGITVSHTNDLEISVDLTTGCKTSNGTGVTMVGNREVDTKVEDLGICKTAAGEGCPTGTVIHTAKASQKSITVDFDGTATAAVTGPRGHTADVSLVCAP